MRILSKANLKQWVFIILAWLILYYLYYIISWGLSDYLAKGIMKDYLTSTNIHLEVILAGLLFGVLFNIIDMITDKTFIRRRSFGFIIFFKSLLYIFMMLIVVVFVASVFYLFRIEPFNNPQEIWSIYSLKFYLSWIVYFIFSVLLMNFINQVNRKFGPGNLSKLILGKYHKPKEEYRIFLFLDLKGSTTIAEKLGHNVYSQFLRNCYHDLTDIVLKYNADIYQYVGDEVVLSWKIADVSRIVDYIGLFFAYEKRLNERQDFYLRKYNHEPEFKGGMDMGVVTVTEIGDIKREIAYHGDVLNTASRIQDQCKILDKNLLISENVEKNLLKLNGFKKEFIGDVNLRGKVKTLKIYSLDQI
jgi:adenylate cyclase